MTKAHLAPSPSMETSKLPAASCIQVAVTVSSVTSVVEVTTKATCAAANVEGSCVAAMVLVVVVVTVAVALCTNNGIHKVSILSGAPSGRCSVPRVSVYAVDVVTAVGDLQRAVVATWAC